LAAERAPSVISPGGELTPPPLRRGGEFK
ncbi:hypothetical protein, partial [Caulobacter vibrioides]